MLVELVSTTNAKGVRLDGAFYSPPVDAVPIGPVDAVLLIHGSRGNFADPATKEMVGEIWYVGEWPSSFRERYWHAKTRQERAGAALDMFNHFLGQEVPVAGS